LVGTPARPDIIDQLGAFQRLYLVLDQDDAGLEATLRLADALGPHAVPVALPDGVKDIGELAPPADGQAIFARSLLEAVGIGVAAAHDSDLSDVASWRRRHQLVAPLADRLMADDDAPLGEQILNVAEAEVETKVQPDRVSDDLGREAVTSIERVVRR